VGFPASDARELNTGARAQARLQRRAGAGPAVALVTCAELPDGDEDTPELVAALALRGVGAAAAVWDDPDVDWRRFDLVVPRSAWDYAERRDEFLAWAARVPRVLNPLPVLEWNTDKHRYLVDLAAAGVPVVPTVFVEPGEPFTPPDDAPFVVKPSISAGGRSSARFEPGDADAADALVRRIHAERRTAMVQPLLDGAAETALVYIGGRYSHALGRRVPLPRGGAQEGLYLEEELEPAEASAAERALAEQALAAAPDDLLYARVDLMGGVVLELEVAEPSLYLAFGAGAADRFASAIAALL
jgi:glutathione synthase/RimK-type ligase-like ATP-grasp enzyme